MLNTLLSMLDHYNVNVEAVVAFHDNPLLA